MTAFWSWPTFILYLLMGFIPLIEVNRIKHGKFVNNSYKDMALWFWFVSWTLIASYRLVGYGIGGSDAAGYIDAFNKVESNRFEAHTFDDIGFYWINKIIHLFAQDYHVYFIIVYSFITFSFAYFYRRFLPKETNIFPIILTVYLYTRSFSTIRSNLAISMLLIALVLYSNKKYVSTILLLIFSVLVHKMMAPFVLFLPLYHLIRNKNFKIELFVILFFVIGSLSIGLGSLIAPYVAAFNFEGAYESYLSREGTWIDSWVIFSEQIALGVFIVIMNKKLTRYIIRQDDDKRKILNLLYMICLFDILMVPICGALGIWRGDEVFFIPRKVMMGILLYLFLANKGTAIKIVVNSCVLIIITAWLYNRYYATFEKTCLMPYMFDFNIL